MNTDIRINGSSTVFKDWGVRMGDGFIDALTEPLTPKEYIENESRLEHGKRVIVSADDVKFASREVVLDFTIEGKSQEDFFAKKKLFLAAIYKGNITIEVPAVSDDVYHLVYKGKGGEYGMNVLRTFCHMILKFEEPDPTHRTLL